MIEIILAACVGLAAALPAVFLALLMSRRMDVISADFENKILAQKHGCDVCRAKNERRYVGCLERQKETDEKLRCVSDSVGDSAPVCYVPRVGKAPRGEGVVLHDGGEPEPDGEREAAAR